MDRPVNESELLAAVLAYQESKLERDAETVLRLADPLIHGMLGRAVTVYGVDVGDAYSRIRVKVWRALRTYRPEAGRVFSYLNATVQNSARTICNEHLRSSMMAHSSDETAESCDENAVADWRSAEAMEDIQHKLCSLRTLCTRENELRAQKWLVRGLIQSGFSIPRHELVKALRIVFNVDLKTGRLIHDKTILELRRTMLGDRRGGYPPIDLAHFKDRRAHGLLRFKPYLSYPDFCKLCFLMKNLAPALLLDLIQRETRSLNGEGTPERRRAIIRKYLAGAINGFPDAAPLFPNGNLSQ